jgi:hypothetical protein
MRKRRRRKNPDTTSLLLLGGLAAGGYYLYKKSQKPRVVVTPGVVAQPVNPVTQIIGSVTNWLTEKLSGSGPVVGGCNDSYAKSLVGKGSGGNKVIAGGGCNILTQNGGCYDLAGKPVPTSNCSHLSAALQLEGMGTLGSCGLGSLGNC